MAAGARQGTDHCGHALFRWPWPAASVFPWRDLLSDLSASARASLFIKIVMHGSELFWYETRRSALLFVFRAQHTTMCDSETTQKVHNCSEIFQNIGNVLKNSTVM
jgi:hypothetical protein